MLRIHFSSADVLGLRVSAAPDPLWELLLSLHAAQTVGISGALRAWRTAVRGKLAPSAALLWPLARPQGYSPDFLTPTAGEKGFDAGLDQLLATSRPRLRADLALLARPTSWTTDLADGRSEALHRLGDALEAYHAVAIEPFWDVILRVAGADRERRAATAIAEGAGTMLTTLHPDVRWDDSVLEVAYPVDQDVHLDGQGLTLVPSFFCRPGPITLLRQNEQPILVYPVDRDLESLATVGHARFGQGLTALLGRTRARVLHAIAAAAPVTTSDLAREVGVSVAGISQHTSVLRDAGLITTVRDRGFARHRVSPRGEALLSG
ncbi:winged helix-turn-helix domain-containing protein [Amycolatopsis umgeniensis]|uniref:DNA-binding transcriptional ArsR family regulator n=1 Tax=Amycolatopsis umgeniensis TaxID=336628 RepID=A0A841BIG5_9PSEU|nr:helix-turn-helix domain-containing protein [Amycolatopsis umgeniensis]MBB5858294.1 DNA-binding transcriptional ArsR family regulator [Amycolatopsis umgeniensis]